MNDRMKNLIQIILLISAFYSLNSCDSKAQDEHVSGEKNNKIQVIQFHSEHRCMTCKKIESLTKHTLDDYKDIQFLLINVDKEKNKKKAEEFEAAGTSLFLYNPSTGEKVDLTAFAFMNAGNKEKFISELKIKINNFRD